MAILVLLLLASTISLYKVEGCVNNIECITETTYQFCVVISASQTVLVNGVYTCGTGTICDENGSSACVEGTSSSTSTTTTSETTTTLAVGPPDSCSQAAKYPAEACNQYWECVSVWWWFELKLQTCDTNLAYSSSLQECVADSTCTNTTTDSTTISTSTATESTTIDTSSITESTTIDTSSTTESTAITTPTATESTTIITPTIIESTTVTAPATTESDTISTSTTTESTTIATPITTDSTTITEPTTIESTTISISSATESTTTAASSITGSTTITTTTSIGPPATCTTTGKYTADACNQYWECVYVMWWYELVLQTCGTNQAYDATTQACVANSTCYV